jgi:hypothetical protein
MRGWALWYRPYTPLNRMEALKNFEQALSIDPRSVEANIGAAMILVANVGTGLSQSRDHDSARADSLIDAALALDANSSQAHEVRGMIRRLQGRMDDSATETPIALSALPCFPVQVAQPSGTTRAKPGPAGPGIRRGCDILARYLNPPSARGRRPQGRLPSPHRPHLTATPRSRSSPRPTKAKASTCSSAASPATPRSTAWKSPRYSWKDGEHQLGHHVADRVAASAATG